MHTRLGQILTLSILGLGLCAGWTSAQNDLYFERNRQLVRVSLPAKASPGLSMQATPVTMPAVWLFGQNPDNNAVLFAGSMEKALPNTDMLPGSDLWIAYPGGAAQQLLADHKVVAAELAAAGDKLAYWDKQKNLYVVDLSTVTSASGTVLSKAVNARLIAKGGVDPKWAPNGQELAFATMTDPALYDPPNRDIRLTVALPDGSDKVELTQGYDDVHPAWSPDGKWIVFVSGSRTGLASFWMVARDGGNLHQVTNRGKSQVDAAFIPVPYRNRFVWASGGTRAAYESSAHDSHEIWLLEWTKGLDQPATGKLLGKGEDPRWLDQGTTLAVFDSNSGTARVILIGR